MKSMTQEMQKFSTFQFQYLWLFPAFCIVYHLIIVSGGHIRLFQACTYVFVCVCVCVCVYECVLITSSTSSVMLSSRVGRGGSNFSSLSN